MSVITRGAKNAFRNKLRAGAIVLMLAISIGLALAMLLANQAVQQRITGLKSTIGTTVLVHPAGSRNFMGGGEPLSQTDADAVKALPHVVDMSATLESMVQSPGGNNDMQFRGGSAKKVGETNLEPATNPGTLGKQFQVNGDMAPADFKLPIRVIGTSGDRDGQGNQFGLSQGRQLQGDHEALVGKKLAEKNSLQLGSTFQAYGETFSVVGIFDAGTQFENDTIVIPLATLQRLTDLGDQISTIVAEADSIDNLEGLMTSITTTLGEDKADVSTTQQNATQAVEALMSVQRISVVGFVLAIVAAGVVIFLTMLMIVRERRREIGVLKAIGGSNRSIVAQFMVEAVVLVSLGTLVGLAASFVAAGSIADSLVASNTPSQTEDQSQMTGGGKGQAIRLGSGRELEDAQELIGTITTTVGLETIGYAILSALLVALLGSAAPAWFIAKVRPAEVMRGE